MESISRPSFLVVLLVLFAGLTLSVSAQNNRLYSYICLNAQDRLCLAISTNSEPVYSQSKLYFLQVKLRVKIEQAGQDYLKTRWSVYSKQDRIQLSNFTTLCAARRTDSTTTPGDAVLRPCDDTAALQQWDLSNFLANETAGTQLRLKAYPNQCLTLMTCNRANGYCDKASTTAYTGTKISASELKGAYVKLMPCKPNSIAQRFTQTIDCAPGCSPFMGQDDVCDPECANDACNWDNGACSTPAPTPPTPKPSNAPTFSPSISPTKQPTTLFPTASPTPTPTVKGTTAPTNPTGSPTSRSPTTVSPTAPSVGTQSPVKTPVPTSATKSPTSVTKSPSSLTTATPTSLTPTMSPVKPESAIAETSIGRRLWYVWLIIILLLLVLLSCCCLFLFGAFDKKKEEGKNLGDDVENTGAGAAAGLAGGAAKQAAYEPQPAENKRPLESSGLQSVIIPNDGPVAKKTNVIEPISSGVPVPAAVPPSSGETFGQGVLIDPAMGLPAQTPPVVAAAGPGDEQFHPAIDSETTASTITYAPHHTADK